MAYSAKDGWYLLALLDNLTREKCEQDRPRTCCFSHALAPAYYFYKRSAVCGVLSFSGS